VGSFLVVPKEKYEKLSLTKCLAGTASVNTEGFKCSNANCRELYPDYVHPQIQKDEENHFTFYIEKPDAGRNPRSNQGRRGLRVREQRIKLYPDTIKAILERIPNSVVKMLGRGEASHPRKLVLQTINIPPVSIWPGVKNYGSGSNSYHDSSTLLQSIVKGNTKLPEQLPEAIGPWGPPSEPVDLPNDIAKGIESHQQLYYTLLMGSTASSVTQGNTGRRGLVIGSRALSGFLRNLPRKDGRIRQNLLGKRVFYISRSTISGNMKLCIDEIGIPISFAGIMQVEETVQEYNIDWLMPFFLNGRKQYPGSTRILKNATGEVHDVANLRDFLLEILFLIPTLLPSCY